METRKALDCVALDGLCVFIGIYMSCHIRIYIHVSTTSEQLHVRQPVSRSVCSQKRV